MVIKNKWAEVGLILILFIVIIIALGWVNYQFAASNPGGNDFLVHYIGTRSFLFEGISPYSDEVAVRIQTAAYGHPAQGIEHELRVAYPLYSIFLFAPFSLIENYQLARAIWMTVLELALIAMTFMSMELFEWKPALWIQGLLLLFSIVWYHAVRGVVNGNAVILIALILTIVFNLIKLGDDKAAGFLLAVTTIKPHLVVLIIPLILIWAIYQKRWSIIRWFMGTLAALVILGLFLIPNWIAQNLWEILKYPAYNPAGTLAAVLAEWMPGISAQLKTGITITLSLILIIEWWQARKSNFNRLVWTGLFTLVVGQWIGIQTDPGNFILLFPALVMILAIFQQKWENNGNLFVGITLTVLLLGLWILFISTIQKSYQPVQGSIMFLPLPAFCLIGLYWIKWWVVDSKPLIWNEI